MPTPITAASGPRASPCASTRTPPSFAPPSTRSFGHLRATSRAPSDSSARAQATPTTSGNPVSTVAARSKRHSTENVRLGAETGVPARALPSPSRALQLAHDRRAGRRAGACARREPRRWWSRTRRAARGGSRSGRDRVASRTVVRVERIERRGEAKAVTRTARTAIPCAGELAYRVPDFDGSHARRRRRAPRPSARRPVRATAGWRSSSCARDRDRERVGCETAVDPGIPLSAATARCGAALRARGSRAGRNGIEEPRRERLRRRRPRAGR